MIRRGKAKGPRMIKEIHRLRAMGLSKRKIAKALSCSRNTIDKYLAADGQSFEKKPSSYRASWSEEVDWGALNGEINQGKPLQECWEVLFGGKAPEDGAIPYVSFWREYRRRFPKIPLEMHKLHPPGERVEIDYKGDAPGLGYIDRATGDYVPCRLYGATLAFSQLFFPMATHTERQADLLSCTVAAFEYFGGVPLTSVVDNAKALVTKAHRYDPDIHKEFAHFCEHYGTAPIATRPCSPKDKNLIENALGVFWRWAGRRVRGRTFYSIGELNGFMREIADEFNAKTQRKYGLSRKEKFDQGERIKLLPLPAKTYRFGEWKKAKLHPDCHIQIGYNFYSAPYQLRGKMLEVRVTSSLIEVFHDLSRVACHIRVSGRSRGRYQTKHEHLPEAHVAVLEATPQTILEQAFEVGPKTGGLIERMFSEARHPLMYLRRAQGILRLANRYSKSSLEQASEVVFDLDSLTPRLADIEAIIKTNLNPRSATILPIRRNPNPYLRGQQSWSDTNPSGEESN